MARESTRMNTLAISQLSTLRWDFEQDVVAYAERGFSGIGIYRPKLEDFGVERAVDLLAEHSLTATSLSWAGGFTGSDGRGTDDAIRDAVGALRHVADLHAETLVVLAGGRNNHIRNHANRTLCDALRVVATYAEEFGVKISLEPIHPGCGDEWCFVNNLQSTLNVIEAVDSPALGITLDTYHVGMNDGVVGWLPDIVPHLHLVQLGDAKHSPLGEMNRCLLGQGCVPIATILQTLNQCGYSGALEVELIGEDLEMVGYDEMLDHTFGFLEQHTGTVRPGRG